jgi:hypothetical protein
MNVKIETEASLFLFRCSAAYNKPGKPEICIESNVKEKGVSYNQKKGKKL